LQGNGIYYVPLTAPGDEELFPPGDLFLRTHESFLLCYDELDTAEGGERHRLAQECGLNRRPMFARLGSIDLSSCAPYEMMHLIYENLVPNMVIHWKGTFKWLDHEEEVYPIDGDVWEVIGRLTAEATRTVPAQFVSTLPNIDRDMNFYKAEAFSFWFTYLAPILLNGRLNQEHYEHFLDMREIVLSCLELEITHAQVDELERKVNEWVVEYERPALANQVRPYEYLDNFIRRRAQMQIVSHVHNMPSLIKPITALTLQAGELISSKEEIYDDFPDYVLGQPVNRRYRANEQLKRQMTRYFRLAEGGGLTAQQLCDRIDWNTLVRHGRFRMASMGDRVHVANLVQASSIARDNSFIRYELLPDRNAHLRHERDQPIRVIHYGRVQDVFYVEYIRDPATNTRQPYLLARVQECNTQRLDAADPENPIVTYNRLDSPEIIHLGTVHAVVGRIKVGGRNTWAIIDRSRVARTQFNNDEGDADPNVD
ncbi:hypothetical protein FRC10_005363, partial [Ceratobasidium sp. 414]